MVGKLWSASNSDNESVMIIRVMRTGELLLSGFALRASFVVLSHGLTVFLRALTVFLRAMLRSKIVRERGS
jgi:hypothetical protein